MAEKKELFADKLSKILVKQNLFSPETAKDMAKLFSQSTKESFDDFLLEEGLVTKEALLDALSKYYETPFFDVVGYFFNHQLVTLFPKDELLRNSFIPLWLEEDILTIVASRPDDPKLRDLINQYVDFGIEFYVGLERDINDSIKEFYDRSPSQESQEEWKEKEEEEEEEEIARGNLPGEERL